MGASDLKGLAGLTNRNWQSCEKFEIFVGKVRKIFWAMVFSEFR